MVATACNPNTQEVKIGGSQVQGQPEIHSKTHTHTHSMPELKETWKKMFII